MLTMISIALMVSMMPVPAEIVKSDDKVWIVRGRDHQVWEAECQWYPAPLGGKVTLIVEWRGEDGRLCWTQFKECRVYMTRRAARTAAVLLAYEDAKEALDRADRLRRLYLEDDED